MSRASQPPPFLTPPSLRSPTRFRRSAASSGDETDQSVRQPPVAPATDARRSAVRQQGADQVRSGREVDRPVTGRRADRDGQFSPAAGFDGGRRDLEPGRRAVDSRAGPALPAGEPAARAGLPRFAHLQTAARFQGSGLRLARPGRQRTESCARARQAETSAQTPGHRFVGRTPNQKMSCRQRCTRHSERRCRRSRRLRAGVQDWRWPSSWPDSSRRCPTCLATAPDRHRPDRQGRGSAGALCAGAVHPAGRRGVASAAGLGAGLFRDSVARPGHPSRPHRGRVR